ncbi:hypothetical protein O181_125019 [Austropuccinia psidii MF-1]|uniref:Uncharacterized protein n=1 Tax=Austropuccinia psidii MF-1 TaxID=1389203 RepID=A0A9Q3Q4T4_9BASI|nr:hypothetical protein [Austropuccinia psidii MF-1]
MRPKAAKGAVHHPPKPQVGHLSQFLTKNPMNPKWPKTILGPKLAIKISPCPLETIRGYQIGSKHGLTSSSGEVFPSFNALCTQRPGVVLWYSIPFLKIDSWKIKIKLTNSGNHHSKDILKITKNPGITSTVGRNGRF